MVTTPARLTAGALLGALLGLFPASPATAEPVCTIKDSRLDEVSGLVADGAGFVVMNDSRSGESKLSLYRLDARCAVTGTITDRGYDPFDTEDLGRTPDGTLWVADVGDNDRSRRQPAILRLPKGAARGVKYTLRYPDGAADAEAVLMQPDGTAVVVTKELSGVAHVLVTTRALAGPAAVVPMRDAGRVTIPVTDTKGGPVEGSTIVTTLVTGGAVAPDARRVVLRTYTDAYEWDVPQGDIAAALVDGEPRRTPVPGEPQGEAISYTPDGSAFLTASEGVGQPLQRWVPTARTRPSPSASAAEEVQDAGRGVSWIAVVVGAGLAAGAVGCVVLAIVLVRAVRRRVRRRRG